MDAQTVAKIQRRLKEHGVLREEDLTVLNDDSFGSATLGLTWHELSRDRAVASLDVDARFHQPFGIVHGGVWCSVVESLASMGAIVQVMDTGQVVVGVSNTTDFLRPHREGRIDAVATPLHRGRTQQLWQVVLSRHVDGKVVARGQVRLQNIEQDAVGP